MQTILRYVSFMKPYYKTIILVLFLGLLDIIIPFLYPLAIKYILDDVLVSTMPSEEKIKEVLIVLGGMVFLFSFVRFPAETLRGYYNFWIVNRILCDIRNKLFQHIQLLSLKFHQNNKGGDLTSRIISDVENTKFFVRNFMFVFWFDLIMFIAVTVMMFKMNVILTFIALGFLFSYSLFGKQFYLKMKHYTKEKSISLANLQSFMQERISGISITKSFVLEEKELSSFQTKNNELAKHTILQMKWDILHYTIVMFIMDIAPIVIFIVASFLIVKGTLTIGTIIAFTAYLQMLFKPVSRILNISGLIMQSLASMERVFDLLDEEIEIKDFENAKSLEKINGDIEFKNVFFQYEDKSILEDINLKINKGETVAFVGSSGSGKSTLTKLLLRLWETEQGEILLDGMNIKELKQHNLRKNIAIVEQNGVIFSDSVAENILVGKPDSGLDEIQEAANKAYASEFIDELTDGYDTELGERGVKLSGGQQQRISIARAFLKNSPILILDESTSALDLISERKIQESIQDLSKGKTVIFIAHRLSTITHVDKIVVMNKGRIVEVGTHTELLENKNEYYDLWKQQEVTC